MPDADLAIMEAVQAGLGGGDLCGRVPRRRGFRIIVLDGGPKTLGAKILISPAVGDAMSRTTRFLPQGLQRLEEYCVRNILAAFDAPTAVQVVCVAGVLNSNENRPANSSPITEFLQKRS